jgi:curved DNA-binding protein CbpA
MTRRKIIPSASPSHSRALIWVDSTYLRDQEQGKCKALYQKLEASRGVLALHEAKSVPEYQKWLYSSFGQQLTQVRELQARADELQQLAEAVQAQSLFTGVPEWKAYQSILGLRARAEAAYGAGGRSEETHSSSRQAQAEAEEAERAFKKAEEEYQDALFRSIFESHFGTKKAWRSRHQSYEEAFQEFKEEILKRDERSERKRQKKKQRAEKKMDSEEDSRQPRGNRESSPGTHPGRIVEDSKITAKDLQTQLREQYRTLARKLHPDLNPGLEPKMVELWHQVQAAYEAKDLSRLETLVALSEMHDQSWEKIDRISTLRKLFAELKSALKQLEKRVRMAKGDPAWNFHERMNDLEELRSLRADIAKELKLQEREVRNEVDSLEALIFSWENPSKRDRRRKSMLTAP